MLPEYNVPPLNVVAETEVNEISSSRFTIGLFAVPPVDMFTPPETLVISLPSAVVRNISERSVLPE